MQLAARKAQECTAQIDCQLHNIIPRPKQKEIIAARVDNMHIACRFLFTPKERELLHPMLPGTDCIDITFEEQRKLTRERRRSRQCRVCRRKPREERRAEIVHIRTEHAKPPNARCILRPTAPRSKTRELEHMPILPRRIVTQPEMRRETLPRIDLVLDIEPLRRLRQMLDTLYRLRCEIELPSDSRQRQHIRAPLHPNTEHILLKDALPERIERIAHRARLHAIRLTVGRELSRRCTTNRTLACRIVQPVQCARRREERLQLLHRVTTKLFLCEQLTHTTEHRLCPMDSVLLRTKLIRRTRRPRKRQIECCAEMPQQPRIDLHARTVERLRHRVRIRQ